MPNTASSTQPDPVGGQPSEEGPRGLILSLMRFSTQDGPGLRTTVFLKGCPLACAWCHNPESQSPRPRLVFRARRCLGCGECAAVCPQGASRLEGGGVVYRREGCTDCGACAEVCPTQAREVLGRFLTVAELVAELAKDRDFYEQSGGGVTFSGGEPLAQPGFLAVALAACQERGWSTAVDTCGHSPWREFDGIASRVNLFLYDLKLLDEAEHVRLTGASNRLILDNLRELLVRGREVLVRRPVIPGVNDSPAQMEALGRFLLGLPGQPRVELLPYHRAGLEKYRLLGLAPPLAALEPPGSARMGELVARLRALGLAAWARKSES